MSFTAITIALIIGICISFLLFKKDKKAFHKKAIYMSIWRGFNIAFLIYLIISPLIQYIKRTEEKPIIVYLQDNSTSIQKIIDPSYIKWINGMDQEVTKFKIDKFGFGEKLTKDSFLNFKQKSTNISEAIEQTLEKYNDKNLAAIILASDGNYNAGMNPVFMNTNHVPIYTIGIGDSTKIPDIAIHKVFYNPSVLINNVSNIIVQISAIKCIDKTLQLTILHGKQIIKQSSIKVTNESFDTEITLDLPANTIGLQEYTAYIQPLEQEKNTINNSYPFSIDVTDDRTEILILAKAPHPDISAISQVIKTMHNTNVTFSTTESLKDNNYDLVITHNLSLPATFKTKANWQIINGNSGLTKVQLNERLDIFNISEQELNSFAKFSTINYAKNTIPKSYRHIMLQDASNQQAIWSFDDQNSCILATNNLWQWRMDNYLQSKNHQVVDNLIRNTVNYLVNKQNNQPFIAYLEANQIAEGNPIILKGILKDDNGSLVNNQKVNVQIESQTGHKQAYLMNPSGNTYELNMQNLPAGNYRYTAQLNYKGKNLASKGTFTINAVSIEDLKTNADFESLIQVAQNNQGSFFVAKDANQLFKQLDDNPKFTTVITEEPQENPIIDYRILLLILLLSLFVEWYLRKYLGMM